MLGNDLTEADMPAVTVLANQVGIALENARLLEELTIGRREMQTLANQVVSAQEQERRSLSRSLHDEAGQSLTALAISLELIGQDLPDGHGEVRARIHDAAHLASHTMERIRYLAQDLRPPALDTVGLNYTLKGLCQDFGDRTRLAIVYRGQDLSQLPERTNITLYRFLQEALTNVARHARAHNVRVELQHDAEAVRLTVEDDGQGFDPAHAAPAPGRMPALGLLGMQERLHLLGGRLEIRSAPGKGACLVACIPVQEE
jgi:signal transduction histidine kinase